MTPDQIHSYHKELKRLYKLKEAKTNMSRSPLSGVWLEFGDENRKLLPVNEVELRKFIDGQVSSIEDRLRSQGVAV